MEAQPLEYAMHTRRQQCVSRRASHDRSGHQSMGGAFDPGWRAPDDLGGAQPRARWPARERRVSRRHGTHLTGAPTDRICMLVGCDRLRAFALHWRTLRC